MGSQIDDADDFGQGYSELTSGMSFADFFETDHYIRAGEQCEPNPAETVEGAVERHDLCNFYKMVASPEDKETIDDSLNLSLFHALGKSYSDVTVGKSYEKIHSIDVAIRGDSAPGTESGPGALVEVQALREYYHTHASTEEKADIDMQSWLVLHGQREQQRAADPN